MRLGERTERPTGPELNQNRAGTNPGAPQAHTRMPKSRCSAERPLSRSRRGKPACLVPRLFYPAAPRPGPAPAPLSQAKAAPTPHGGRRNGRQVCAGPTHHSFPEVKAVGRRTAAPNRVLRDTPAPAPHAGLPPRPALLPSARRKECRRYRGGARRAPCGPLPSCRGCSAVP